MEQQKEQTKGFDLLVTQRDEHTGLVTNTDPYIYRVTSVEGGGRAKYWERPEGSGNLFSMKGTPVGRWDATKPEGQRFIKDAPHIAFTPPQTEDQKLRSALLAKDAKVSALEAELAAVKAEKEKKSAPAPQKKEPGA